MLHILIASIYASPLDSSVLPGCDIYQGLDSCQGSNVNVLAAEDARSWQTPPRGAPGYKDSFQDYREITGSPNVVYSADRSSATVTLGVTSRTGLALQYSFDNGTTYQSSATVNVGSTLTASILAIAKDSNGATLKMEPIDLLWNNAKIPNIPQFRGGQKGAIVDLFGWKWADIEKECPMLAKAGYLGAKINPPNEHLITQDWLDNSILNPWYYVYQPVSYRLHSRGGSRAELRSMIQTCRALGVRIYADAVINHMTGGGNDIQNHRRPARGSCVTWGPKSSTGGSPFYTFSNTFATNPFTNARPGMEYPGVPWKPTDFHCDRVLNAYNDPLQLDAGWLVGLSDLNTGLDSVQERIAQYLTDLINIGFSGFRIDAAKHIKPASLAKILAKTRKNLGGSFPEDFLTWLEVILGGEKDLLACNPGDYNWYTSFDQKLAAEGIISSDIAKVKMWSSDYPKEMPVCGSWILPPSRFVIQNDDHDQQNPGSSSRDMQDFGSVLIKDKDLNRHRNFEIRLFTRTDNDWAIKVVLSSYSFGPNGEAGFLDGLSDCSTYTGKDSCRSTPGVPAFDANSCGYSCFSDRNGGGWKPFSFTRVHRDRQIINAMRQWIGLPNSSDVGIPGSC